MKLSALQIDQLYEFTRKHFVEHYDLQTELVDHLANAIEAQLAEKPNLTFEDALQIEFKKFGVYGFSDVVEERRATLSKKYNKLVWKHFKDFFTLPKIILTATLVSGLFYYFKNLYSDGFFFLSIFLFYLILFPYLYVENKKIKKRKKETGKVWLFEQIIFGYGAFSGILTVPFQVVNITFNHKSSLPNDYVLFGVSLVIVSIFLVCYIILKIIPSKAQEYLKETYPEYTLVKNS